ncbi:MAG: saccharopine dehydrogenase NADP-binding domain-containing protein [Cyclobacteriaceae bacterium]
MQTKNTRENTIILYGSYGYTGRLIARECKARGLHVILSGRKEEPLTKQSEETGYPGIVADLDNTSALEKLLEKGRVLIHCGGPFQFTAKRIVEMCLRTHTHYTDISGEYQVFEMLASYDLRAKQTGITILPGTGFDVVPSDCLAVYLKSRLPGAARLELAFAMSKGGLSRGTAKTMVHGLGDGSVVRKDGKLIHIPLGEKIKDIDFGAFKARCLNIPWGDVSTAWYSTGIADIEVYAAANSKTIAAARMSRYFNWLTRSRWVKNFLLRRIDNKKDGPGAERINLSKSFLWGRVSDHSGNSETATIQTLSGYKLTAKTSVLIAEKILAGNFKTGFQTPGGAYGHGLILEIENTTRQTA